jgi:mannose-6-phosphate isomerase-like protein (cupin superfamily)
VVHSHKVWTGVVIIMSGAATFVTPGRAAKTGAVTNEFGAQAIGSGESHRISKGDVVVIPPDAPHFYKNIEEPFRYLVIQTP